MNDQALQELASQLGEVLSEQGALLATAESCTGGWVAKCLTDVPGSSKWFDRGYVVYNGQAKQQMLGVPAAIIEANGEVSEAVVRSLAEGVLANSNASISLSISGMAGPGGGSDDLRARRDAELLCLRVAHHDRGGGTVVQRARVAGRDAAARLERRLERGQPRERR